MQGATECCSLQLTAAGRPPPSLRTVAEPLAGVESYRNPESAGQAHGRCSIADRDFKFAPVIGRVLSSQTDPQAASARRFQKKAEGTRRQLAALPPPSRARVQLKLRVALVSLGCSGCSTSSGLLPSGCRIASFRLPHSGCCIQWSVVHRMNSAN
jgi:hypothetical protein